MRHYKYKPIRLLITYSTIYWAIRHEIVKTNGFLSNTSHCHKERLALDEIRNRATKESIPAYKQSLQHASFMLAFCYHTNNDLERANRYYLETRSVSPEFSFPLVNLALIHLEQNPLKAIELLEIYFSEVGGIFANETNIVDLQSQLHGPSCTVQSKYVFDCITALNYYGNAKWKLYLYYEAEDAYRRAIDIGNMNITVLSDVYINLGELMLVMNEPEKAEIAFMNASIHEKFHNGNDFSTELRRALVIPSISESIESAAMMEHHLFNTINRISQHLQMRLIDFSRIQSVHFYFHYYGFNDRKVHEQISRIVVDHSSKYEFEVSNSLSKLPDRQAKKRIVFISCLLHGNEPHGQLILNVLQHLPRSIFELILVSLSSKRLSTEMIEAVDAYHQISPKLPVARKFLTSIEPDCLIFVESLNTGTMYFLAHERFAPIQIMLMGAPVTSGIQDTIDYFLSADRLEHPFRTQISGDNEDSNPYTEQVVLFDGQGISFPLIQYHSVDQNSTIAAGEATSMPALDLPHQRYQYGEYGLPVVNGSLYFCFQSLFKIQPSFDIVLIRLLAADSSGHVILQAARESSKTKKVANRLVSVVRNEYCPTRSKELLCKLGEDILTRIHFIPRVTSDSIEKLLKHATVVLQPFPFDGSKTATDALSAGIPVVTLPQKYLKGRLTTTFLLSMVLHEVYEDAEVYVCCIASSVDDYLTKALRLGTNREYRNRVSTAIQRNKYRIYDHKTIGEEWTRFLVRALEVPLTTELEEQVKINPLLNRINDEIMIEHQAWWKRKQLYEILNQS